MGVADWFGPGDDDRGAQGGGALGRRGQGIDHVVDEHRLQQAAPAIGKRNDREALDQAEHAVDVAVVGGAVDHRRVQHDARYAGREKRRLAGAHRVGRRIRQPAEASRRAGQHEALAARRQAFEQSFGEAGMGAAHDPGGPDESPSNGYRMLEVGDDAARRPAEGIETRLGPADGDDLVACAAQPFDEVAPRLSRRSEDREHGFTVACARPAA